MKTPTKRQTGFAGALALASMFVASLGLTLAQAQPPDATTPQSGSATGQTNAVAANAKSPEAKPVAAKRQLTGAELYSINCNRCHQERYPTERTAAQWKTLMLHMQVRANIPGQQAKLILQYLQENSGR